ncbi:hypothetical protein [Actinoplanes friuliensis]|jgi:hypothetical protein|uniref:DUF4760 domain-containing protein n=1 Tax=Actinoplanes friuliensis DSM 7358 TaxID=1246995 RepID=U5W7I5_9ACTN|nr:hypothetical protein [Actinoplanes friuliensis]AGZ43960.1 hypothetical protein AFR_28495 [Actinoplanes friuliensis DSM 7358]
MAALLSLLGALGIIGSLLFAGWQARVLATQVGHQATRDGVATLQEALTSLREVQHYLVEDPSLIPHFAPERSRLPLEDADAGKVEMVAAMYCDVLNIGLYNLSAVSTARPESAWAQYCEHLLANSTAIRAEVLNKAWAYPRLSAMVGPQPPA